MEIEREIEEHIHDIFRDSSGLLAQLHLKMKNPKKKEVNFEMSNTVSLIYYAAEKLMWILQYERERKGWTEE